MPKRWKCVRAEDIDCAQRKNYWMVGRRAQGAISTLCSIGHPLPATATAHGRDTKT